MRLGVVGSGSIIPFHLDAAVAAGFEIAIVGSRQGSDRTPVLAERYGAEAGADWHAVLGADVDAFLIGPETSATPAILAAALETGKPIAQSGREWGLSVDQFRWFAEEARRIYGRIVESRVPGGRFEIHHEPVGIAAAGIARARVVKAQHIKARPGQRLADVPVGAISAQSFVADGLAHQHIDAARPALRRMQPGQAGAVAGLQIKRLPGCLCVHRVHAEMRCSAAGLAP